MILPTKHENLTDSSIVIGATLLKKLKNKNLVVDDLYDIVKEKHGISLSKFFDVMLFLWLGGLIEMNEYEVRLVGRTV